MLVVTTDDLPGHQVQHVLGEVIGVTGRTRNPFQEGVRRLTGGTPDVVKLLMKYRLEAVDQMVQNARKLGANAILGMRFDHRNVSDMWGEICAYGTAVRVDPPPRPAGVEAPGGRVAEPVEGREMSPADADYEIAPAVD